MNKDLFALLIKPITIRKRLGDAPKNIPVEACPNDTVKIYSKPRLEVCEDCGLVVEGRVVSHERKKNLWVKKCRSCPNTKKPKEIKKTTLLERINPQDWIRTK